MGDLGENFFGFAHTCHSLSKLEERITRIFMEIPYTVEGSGFLFMVSLDIPLPRRSLASCLVLFYCTGSIGFLTYVSTWVVLNIQVLLSLCKDSSLFTSFVLHHQYLKRMASL